MDLLKYEYLDSPEGSYNHTLGKLVRDIRYYTSQVPIEKFKEAMPSLRLVESKLQKYDEEIMNDRRNYIDEIMDALEKESEIEEKLFEDFEWAAKSILLTLFDKDFDLSDYSYELKKNRGVYWLEFYGNVNINDKVLLVVKEVFKSVCYKYGIVFIDGYLKEYRDLYLN
ncbi:hypothetical protein AB9P05_01000 [Roseivirga sp. BDSF3-8]|uniref:hypothetical protein n=1 Tax=Roseivirga sp. BDSF3-8 TaxID=3241598 RepID=UPI003531A099